MGADRTRIKEGTKERTIWYIYRRVHPSFPSRCSFSLIGVIGPGRPGRYHPGPSQSRTRPIKAYGSSSRSFTKRVCNCKYSFLPQLSGRFTLTYFRISRHPYVSSTGPPPRCPPSLRRVAQIRFPAFTGTMRALRLLLRHLRDLTFFDHEYHACRSSLSCHASRISPVSLCDCFRSLGYFCTAAP
jgi:hypothetical protein